MNESDTDRNVENFSDPLEPEGGLTLAHKNTLDASIFLDLLLTTAPKGRRERLELKDKVAPDLSPDGAMGLIKLHNLSKNDPQIEKALLILSGAHRLPIKDDTPTE